MIEECAAWCVQHNKRVEILVVSRSEEKCCFEVFFLKDLSGLTGRVEESEVIYPSLVGMDSVSVCCT